MILFLQLWFVRCDTWECWELRGYGHDVHVVSCCACEHRALSADIIRCVSRCSFRHSSRNRRDQLSYMYGCTASIVLEVVLFCSSDFLTLRKMK